MDPHTLSLRSRPVIPSAGYTQSAKHFGGSSNYPQPPPGKGPPPNRSIADAPRQLPPRLPPLNLPQREDSMDNRPGMAPSTPQAPPWSTSGIPPWSTATRPLSDIRELTEPSLADISNRQSQQQHAETGLGRKLSLSRKGSMSRAGSLKRTESFLRQEAQTKSFEDNRGVAARLASMEDRRGRSSPTRSPNSHGSLSSIYSIPIGSVPPRSSSQARDNHSPSGPRAPSVPPRGQGHTIPNRGKSRSPVKELAARYNAVTADTARRIPSRTFLRDTSTTELLDFPTHRHPRIAVDLHIGATLFVGGGGIEGTARIIIDDAERMRHKRTLAVARISVDLLGVEEFTPTGSGSKRRRNIFLNLATELIDAENPPPHNMVESLKQLSPIDPFWLLTPSASSLPFLVSLPLDVGPPPFCSKNARIRYVLCVTLLVRDSGKQYLVRRSQDVSVLSVYDPEKALMSLPSPLTAADEYIRHRENGSEVVRVAAGLHRQVWVSGTSIFVDVHIANNSKKTIKKLELQLERDILCYKHVAASTLEKSASQARIFDSNEKAVFSKSVFKSGSSSSSWNGVPSHSTDVRTYDLELPRGHATVKCGKYFEVRFFLNIIVGVGGHSGKTITLQLPIILIHMNSLDVVPNSVAQVAAAIQEKRAVEYAHRHRERSQAPPEEHQSEEEPHQNRPSSRTHSRTQSKSSDRPGLPRRPSNSYNVPGRAFAAPRMQSLERMRQEAEEWASIARDIEASPRKYANGLPPALQGPHGHSRRPSTSQSAHGHPPSRNHSLKMMSSFEYHTPPSNRKGRVLLDDDVNEIRRRLRHVRSNENNGSVISRGNNAVSRASSFQRGPGGGFASSLGFREAEVEEDLDNMASVTPGRRRSGSAMGGSFKSREVVPRMRQFERRVREKKKIGGVERWLGGWGMERDRDKERASQEKERAAEEQRRRVEKRERTREGWI
ncbi:hypothetical protein K402DRAFT_404138 [Aulographum hederae CBS 113979]|uniref:Arrestin C-terminal-like domain-containing protein n=1 Tax=Aulographum hederae CBS 113979 TaxID=1176131 RepID=A0A6G1H0V1_9PEZI|nr:hypothetical protein K402DRAFT_404138 [Aulographum hederae CBS 113979]